MSGRTAKPLTPAEIIITYISLGWAIVLLTNPAIFEQSANFARIQSIAQYEWVVGLICLMLAVIKIVGMAMSHRKLRWAGLMLSTIFWILMSASFVFAGDRLEFNTGFIVYSGVAVLCLLTSKEVMLSDRAD